MPYKINKIHFNKIHVYLFFSIFCLISCHPPVNSQVIKTYSTGKSATPRNAEQHIDKHNFKEKLLAACIIEQTNKIRSKYQALPCTAEKTLTAAATAHSREMANLVYFSHKSPILRNKHLEDRLKNAGTFLPGTSFAENLGVDFILSLSEVPYYTEKHRKTIYYYNYETKARIKSQTYIQFAKNMVTHWFNSPGHRKNLLNKNFTKIGIGLAVGRYKNHDAIYVTQNFQGPISTRKTSRSNHN